VPSLWSIRSRDSVLSVQSDAAALSWRSRHAVRTARTSGEEDTRLLPYLVLAATAAVGALWWAAGRSAS